MQTISFPNRKQYKKPFTPYKHSYCDVRGERLYKHWFAVPPLITARKTYSCSLSNMRNVHETDKLT